MVNKYKENYLGPCFIDLEGNLLIGSDYKCSDHIQLEHRLLSHQDRFNWYDSVHKFGWIRVNDGKIVKFDTVVELPSHEINEAQYQCLIKWLDYASTLLDYIDIEIAKEDSIGRVKDFLYFQTYRFNEIIVDDIIKDIKQNYKKLQANNIKRRP